MEPNLGVIGCGSWGKNLVRNFFELKALKTICDSDENALQAVREKNPGVQAAQDYHALLKDAALKAIVISTPPASHFALAKNSLLAEKDVFVEKPLALTSREAQELVVLAKEKKRILMVGHILEYHPAIQKLKALISGGGLGKIRYIYSTRLNLGKFRTEENILWSFAPHDISAILYLLDEMPEEVAAHGGSFLDPPRTDVTITNLDFPSGAKAHIFVSWLHPYKEQKLVVIGDKKMMLFNDVEPKDKLVAFSHKIDWIDRRPVPRPQKPARVPIPLTEPLRAECEHFIECIRSRRTPRTDGHNGLRVLKILEACQESLAMNGRACRLRLGKSAAEAFIHSTAVVDEHVNLGQGSKVWHFSHIQSGARIGKCCVLGQNVNVARNVTIGDFVKIQNNVSVYEGVTLEDFVFCGPSVVFTNVANPRSQYPQSGTAFYKQTLVKKGASLGANSTILCGLTIGRHAFVAAGAVVTKDVPDFALVAGNPARLVGWMSEAGKKLAFDRRGLAFCEKSGKTYTLKNGAVHEVADEPTPKKS